MTIKTFYEQPEHKAFLNKLLKLGPEAQGRLEHLYLLQHCPEYRQELRLLDMEAEMQPALYCVNAHDAAQDGQQRALDASEVVRYQTTCGEGRWRAIDKLSA